jgi:tetratricopeptide (TPR) repeat protein
VVEHADLTRLWAEASERQRQGRFGEAAALLQRLVAAAPQEPAGWVALSDCLLADRRPETALQVCDAGLKRLPATAALHCANARVLQSLSRVDEAGAAYRNALDGDANSAEARFGLALQAVERGEFDSAAELAGPLLAPTASNPRVDWLAARISLGRGDFEGAADRAKRGLAPGLPPDQEAETALLLGDALDGLGRYAEAFAAVTRGKRALHALYAARAAGRESEADKLGRLADWFERADPAPWRAAPASRMSADVRGHAFLVGFARSGTTLLEQALAGHPDLVALEEAPTLADAYDALMSAPEELERLSRLTEAEANHWRAHYWRKVGEGGVNPRGRHFLDKAPAGTLYLPLIAKLFPDARIIFALRDPRDVVLSCFRNSFQMNALTYAFTDLAETARCYAASMRMAKVYRRVLPLQIADARYEALIDDFPGELTRIAGFLGLEARPEMADVAATARRRSVRTPSAPQVRAGLNRAGLGRWRAYEHELASVLPILAPWVAAFGYSGEG